MIVFYPSIGSATARDLRHHSHVQHCCPSFETSSGTHNYGTSQNKVPVPYS